MRYFIITLLSTLPATASANEARVALYGTWGTDAQCERKPIQEGGTVLAEPFKINARWLIQGWHACSLKWGPTDIRENGIFTGAHAQCGEDSVRGYFIGMTLSGEQLTLRWDFPISKGPLKRCPQS